MITIRVNIKGQLGVQKGKIEIYPPKFLAMEVEPGFYRQTKEMCGDRRK